MSRAVRILVCRLSAIGDCILTLPMVCALRQAFPRAHLAWIVEPAGASLLAGHACIDQLMVVPRRWCKSPGTVLSVRRRLLAQRFDVALDVQSLTKSALAAWLSGARQRIGFAPPLGRELGPWLSTMQVASRRQHVVDRYLELLGPLGIETSNVEFRLPAYEEAQQQIDNWLAAQRVEPGFAVINPGAGWQSKVWPAQRYAAVARHLAQQHGCASVVAWSGDEERNSAEAIVAGAKGDARLAPPTSLPQLAALERRARLFVGSDTGPLHLAAALGVPCVALYGPTSPEVCGPYGPRHATVQAELGGRRSIRQAGDELMRAIAADAVCAACDRVLKPGPLAGGHHPRRAA